MKIDKPGRDTLKSYFVKNAVPTASNFEDLIGASLNQRDDGIAKVPGEPLSVQADGDEASLKKLVNLYRNFADLAPAWTLSLSPRAVADQPASARAGLAFSNGDGKTALFLEQGSANVGIGTLNPGRPLHVEGNEVHSGGTGAGFSFADRTVAPGTPIAKMGQGSRWVWYAQDGVARLWTTSDQLTVTSKGDLAVAGDLNVRARLNVAQSAAIGGALNVSTLAVGQGATMGGPLNINGAASVTGAFSVRGAFDFASQGGGCLRVSANLNDSHDPDSLLSYGGNVTLKGNAPQLEFIDTDPGHNDWAIHVNESRMYFIRSPWSFTDLVLDGKGNVGIGTYLPRAKLEVQGGAIMPQWGNGEGAGILFPPDPAGGGGDRAFIRYYSRGGESMTLEIGCTNDADDHILLNPSGNVGVGTLNPAVKLHVVGDIMSNRGILVMSDASVKRDVETLHHGLDAILKLRPVSFNWKDEPGTKKTLGLIAQEVQPVIDEVVSEHAGSEGSVMSVAYSSLIPVLINAVQQLSAQLEDLRQRVPQAAP